MTVSTPGSGERSPEASSRPASRSTLALYPKEAGNMRIRDPSPRAEIAALRKWSVRPAILSTACLSLLLVLAACSTKGREGDQDEERAESPAAEAQEKQAALAETQRPLTPIDWTKVAEGLGKAGTLQPGEVYKVSMPRGDLHVTVDG